jgi:biopolymer transport protein ExbD
MGVPLMWQITASFNLCGYQTRELDLTPVLGVSLIILIALLIGATTMS